MNKKILGCLFLLVIMSIRGEDGAGAAVPSFTLINGIIPESAQDRILSIMATYRSPKNINKLAAYNTRARQFAVPLADEGKTISSIHVTEYHVGTPVAYDYYDQFTPDLIKQLSSGKIGLLVTKSAEEHEKDKTKKLIFSFADPKKVSKAAAAGG